MFASRSCRPLRAGVFTLVCVNVSAHGHELCSGHDVPLPGLLLGTALVSAMAWASADRHHGWWGLASRMLWGQLALHVAFSCTQSLGEHQHTAGTVPTDAAPAWVMLLFHTSTALVAAWWLHRGEEALHTFLRSTTLRILPPLLPLGGSTTPTPAPNTCFCPVDECPRLQPPYLRHSRVLRGPPTTLVA